MELLYNPDWEHDDELAAFSYFKRCQRPECEKPRHLRYWTFRHSVDFYLQPYEKCIKTIEELYKKEKKRVVNENS